MTGAALAARFDRPFRIATFSLLAIAATALFVPTFSGYLGIQQIQAADVDVRDLALSGDESELVVTIALDNPTGSEVTVYNAQLFFRVEGDLVNRPAVAGLDRVGIAPGETSVFEIRTPLSEDRESVAKRGLEDGTWAITGDISVRIGDEETTVNVDAEGSSDG